MLRRLRLTCMSSDRKHPGTKACPCLARSAYSFGPSNRQAFSHNERRRSRRYMDGADSIHARVGSRPTPWPDAPRASHASQRNTLLDWNKRNPKRRSCWFFYRRPSGLHVDVTCTGSGSASAEVKDLALCAVVLVTCNEGRTSERCTSELPRWRCGGNKSNGFTQRGGESNGLRD